MLSGAMLRWPFSILILGSIHHNTLAAASAASKVVHFIPFQPATQAYRRDSACMLTRSAARRNSNDNQKTI
jgi:hypothetical protein